MKGSTLLHATVCALALVVAAPAETHVVTQTGLIFDPVDIEVSPGDTVQWVHTGGFHTVTSGSSCTPDGRFNTVLSAGTVQYVIPANEPAGDIPYYCDPHCGSGMIGNITVLAAPVPAASEWGLTALSLLVLIGGTATLRQRCLAVHR